VRALSIALGAAATLASAPAWADQVAVLRFQSSGGVTTNAQVEAARAATRDAVVRASHTLPPPALASAADVVVKDGAPDTTSEYREAGRASAAQWTVAGHVEAHGWTYRLELEACLVATGRVESLAREIDARQPVPEITEMLALLLRPQGVGDAAPPWEQGGAGPVVTPAPAPAPPPNGVITTPPPVAYTPPPAPEPARPPYANEHPFALGLGIEGLGAFARAANARGSAAVGDATVDVGYAFSQVPGFELRAGFAAGVLGPGFVRADVGARYMMLLVPKARVFVGPEARFGGFFVTGGDKSARLWLGAAVPVAFEVTERVTIEAYPELGYAAGGTAGLGFVGGGARGVLRF
jgi:hypothetical protein